MRLRGLAGFLCGLALLATSAAAQPPAGSSTRYVDALRRAEQGDLASARALIDPARDPLFDKLLRWLAITRARGGSSFAGVAAFITESADWPAQAALSRRAEELLYGESPATVLGWFDRRPPVSRDGKVRLAEALAATGRES